MLYKLQVLSEQQIKDIHEKTLIYIENHGLTLKNEQCRELLAAYGATVMGEVVKIPRNLVEAALKQVPASFEIVARDRNKNIKLGVDCPTIYGPTTGNPFVTENGLKRNASAEDWVRAVKLAHTSDVCDFMVPTIIDHQCDDIVKMYNEYIYKSLLMSDKAFVGIAANPQIARLSLDMAKIAVQAKDGQYYTMCGANTNSPLVLDDNMAAAIYQVTSAGQPIMISSCAMAGLTSHIGIAETILITNIEIIFAIVLAQAVKPGIACIYGNVSGSSDLKTLTVAMSSPDTHLLTTATAQMAKFYNVPARICGCYSDAKTLDAQAGLESGLSMLISGLNNGSLVLHAFGMLEAFNAISFDKWLLDEEIVRYGQYLLHKEVAPIKGDIIDIINQIGHGKRYLYEKSTLSEFKEAFFIPQICDRLSYDIWHKQEIDIESTCNKLCAERIDSYKIPPIEQKVANKLKDYYHQLA